MKKRIFFFAAMVAVLVGGTGLLTSCEEPYYGDFEYGPAYHYRFFWHNALDEEVRLTWTAHNVYRRGERIDERAYILTPGTTTQVTEYTQRGRVDRAKGGEMPVYGVEDAPFWVLFGYYVEGYEFRMRIEVGDKVLDFHPADHLPIFRSGHYRPEVVNDSTFHYYFDIDSAYISSVEHRLNLIANPPEIEYGL